MKNSSSTFLKLIEVILIICFLPIVIVFILLKVMLGSNKSNNINKQSKDAEEEVAILDACGFWEDEEK